MMWLFDRECIKINRSNITTIYFLESINIIIMLYIVATPFVSVPAQIHSCR